MVNAENKIFITFRSATGSLMQPLGLVEIKFCLTPNTAMDHFFISFAIFMKVAFWVWISLINLI